MPPGSGLPASHPCRRVPPRTGVIVAEALGDNEFSALIETINEEMALDDFLHWWDVSRDQLAVICGCSKSTVNQWFSRSKVKPQARHLQRLASAHRLLIHRRSFDPQSWIVIGDEKD